MNLSSLELTLYTGPTYVPKTITILLNDLLKIKDFPKKLSKLNDFIQKHKPELCKICANCKYPHCIVLAKGAVESMKEEATKEIEQKMKSAESQRPMVEFLSLKRSSEEEQRASLEKDCEFLPLKRSSVEEHRAFLEKDSRELKNLVGSSLQVWSPNYDKKQKTTIKEFETPYYFKPCKLNYGGGAFTPFKGSSCSTLAINFKTTIKGADIKGNNTTAMSPVRSNQGPNFEPKQSKQPKTSENSRRYWSPELHEKFMHAIWSSSEALKKYRLHNRGYPACDSDPNVNPPPRLVSFRGYMCV